MPPGPPPTPKADLKARGSWLADERPDELTLKPGEPHPDRRLSKNQQRIWDFLISQLGGKGVLAEADGPALCVLVRLLDDDRKVAAAVKRTVIGSTDWKRIFIAQQDIRRQLKDYFARFGLTPADRPRVKIDKAKETDGKARFFQPRIAG